LTERHHFAAIPGTARRRSRRNGREHDITRTLLQQGVAGCVQRRTRRDDVVNDKHRRTSDIRTGSKFGSIESLSSTPTRLGHGCSASIE
jgi:hypothetical protein